jgi:hypothetical protein
MLVPVVILFLFGGSILYFLGVFNSWWAPIQGLGHVLVIALITLSVFYGIEIVVNHAVIPIGEHYGKPAHDWALSPDHREPAWDNDDETAPTATAITTEPSPATVATTPDTTAQESSCLTDAQKAMVEQASLPDYAKDHAATMKADDPLCATVRTAVDKLLNGGSTSSSTTTGVHTFEWATGDLYGIHGQCQMVVSMADQPLQLPPTANPSGIAQSSFNAYDSATYDAGVQGAQQAAINDVHNPSGKCDIVSQPTSFPWGA